MNMGMDRRWAGLLLLLFILWANEASAWWNDGWQYRKRIGIDTTVNGADIKQNLMDVPVLIRLHPGNFDFKSALAEGEDIRFVSSDDTKLLKHHIEQFDIIDEMALIWVKLPRLSGQTNQEYIWMYYGNRDAMGGQDAKATFDTNQTAVFHFSEIEGPPQDVSPYSQSVTDFSGGLGLPTVIGRGLMFNGAGDRLILAHSPSLAFTGGCTFSAWVRINQAQDDAYLFHAASEEGEIVVGIDGSKVYGRVITPTQRVYETEKNADLAMGQWHHVMIAAGSNQRMTLYLNGLEMFFVNMEAGLPDFSSDYVVGSAMDGSHGYAGDMDEFRLSNVARPAAWARAAVASQGAEARLYTLGQEEVGEGGGLPVFYLKTVFQNISLDGWVIIMLLVIFSCLSWYVFLTKAFFIRLAEREDGEFMDAYEKNDHLLGLNNQGDDRFSNSSLYRVYRAGCEKLKNLTARSENPGDDATLDERAMNSFKAVLDRGYVDETRKLNSGLVFLTMAITGGPFLGLLGTVWGIMNTFAAMAEAGEASIMAIAPGVASALSTTVFGLIVAIPALFSYNYLLAKVKNITAEMGVFMDQFILNADEAYGDDK